MNEWNCDFHDIAVLCEDKCVRIKKNKALVEFLRDPDTTGSLMVAEYARKLYEEQLGKPLGITKESLAIEILGHVFVDQFAEAVQKLKIKVGDSFLNMIRMHMEVIDCGEADIDNNRKIWDGLSKGRMKDLVFALSGKNA